MALRTLVKAGRITNLSDARYCAGMGVDLLGFRAIEGQENFVPAKAFQEMRGWIAGPQIVAEVYGIQHVDELTKIIDEYRPDYFELGVNDLQEAGRALTLPYILSINNGDELPHDGIKPAYILLNAKATHFEKVIPNYDVLVSVSSLQELEQVLHQTGISGVALNGGKEIRPGLKSYDELAEILEALEVD